MRPTSRRQIPALTVALAVVPYLAAADVNYVPNPGFESCGPAPASWAPVASEAVSCAAPNSGTYSLELTGPGNTSLVRAQSDCVVVPPSTPIQTFRFAYRTASSAVLQVALTANAYTSSDCNGNNGVASAGAGAAFLTPIATDGNWHTLPNVTYATDAATHSIRFTLSFQVNPATEIGPVDIDDLEFTTMSATSTTTTPGSTSTSTSGATTSTTSATGTSTTTLPRSFAGTGSAASECYVTFEGIGPSATGRFDCVDGDPACDADGAANGRCRFDFRVCVAQAVSGCEAGTITAVKATPAKLALPLPTAPTSAPTCGGPAQVVVALRKNGRRPGRATLAFVAKSDGKPKRERDVLRLRCLPPS